MRPVEIGDFAPDLELKDCQGSVVRLGSLWQEQPAVLWFLRHLGCPCTGEQVERIRRDWPRFRQAGATLAVITLGPAERAARLFDGPEGPKVLLDPQQQAYQAYGLGQGGLWELAGPPVWLTALKAPLRGRIGRPAGDVRQLAGTFLVDRQGILRYVHRAAHSADFPDHEAILALLPALAY